MPPHTSIESAEELPTPFLAAMQSGLRLILIHNAVVRRSKRPFGQIPKFHKEFSKPYRMAENLRYWKKAAEIRFDLRLKFDVMAVVNGTDKGWQDFERDIAIWSECVLVEVRKDWELGEGAASVGQVRANRSNTMMDWDHLEGVSSTESSSAHAAMGKVRANRSSTMMSMKVEVGEHWNPIKYN